MTSSAAASLASFDRDLDAEPPRVLFVDDEPNILNAIRRALFRCTDWEVEVCGDPEQALRIIAEDAIDAVVTDMRMPSCDGAELLRIVHERHPGVVRMVLSGHSELKRTLEALSIAHQFLMKPVDIKLLVDTVTKALQVEQKLAELRAREMVVGVSGLPSRPGIYDEFCRITASEEYGLRDVSRLLETDIGVSSTLLRVVNSAAYGTGRHLGDVHQAVSMLGIEQVRALTLTASLSSTFPLKPWRGFNLDAFAEHSVKVAQVARALAEPLGDEVADRAFTAGLLHDAGRLVLASRERAKMMRITALSQNTGRATHELEQDELGITHAEVGGNLLALWGMSYEIVDAVTWHHDAARLVGRELDVAVALYCADRVVGSSGQAPFDARAEGTVPPFLEEIGQAELAPAVLSVARGLQG